MFSVEYFDAMWLNVWMDPNDVRDIHRYLSQDWGIEALRCETPDWDLLLDALTRRVDHLLTHDYERLLHGMYLIDVSEERFNQALDPAGAEIPPRAIAKLILERELEKLESRRRYSRAGPLADSKSLEDQPRIESRDE